MIAGGLVRSGDPFDYERVLALMKANQAKFRVVTMCRVLGVSPEGQGLSGRA